MNNFLNNERKQLIITIDGIDGVGKTSFIHKLEEELNFYLAKGCKQTFNVCRVSPFGEDQFYSSSKRGTSYRRKVLKWFIDKIGEDGYSWKDKESDNSVLENLFFLANASLISDIKNQQMKFGKRIYLLDRSFVTYQVYQEITVSDFISEYDACIILKDDINNVYERLNRRNKKDKFDNRTIEELDYLQNKFIKYFNNCKKIKNNPPTFLYDVGGYYPANEDSDGLYNEIAKKFIYEFFEH